LRFRSMARAAVPVLTLSLVLVACGDDDDEATDTTEATDEAGGENEELCALAEEMFEQDSFPTPEQIEQYTELAPDEIADAVAVAGPPIIEGGGDLTATLAAGAVDEVEEATYEIDEWERENCGVDHEPRYPEEANELDPDAARVDVTASEYTFVADPTEVAAGKVSFVLVNEGQEAHFLALSKIAEGHTIEEALAFDGDPEEAGIVENAEYETGLAAPGGEDEEIVTLDLEAGDYALLCFIPGPDGTPHAFSGMAVPYTVTEG
jgi:uncharacterized cupredoxin-like copper-binding protein